MAQDTQRIKLSGHTDAVICLSLAKDSKLLASGSEVMGSVLTCGHSNENASCTAAMSIEYFMA